MRALVIPALLVVSAWTGAARADIPTADAVLLTERAQTSSTTIKLVPITTGRQNANQGVNCAVTTGKKAGVTDPTVQPQPGAGRRTIQPYAPDMPAVPAPGAQGGVLGSQTLFGSAGDVVAGLDASRSTLGAAGNAFRATGQQVGTAPTVMGALDMNSGVRTQNNLAWNGTIGSANLWVTALNALNLARTGDASRAATGMTSGSFPVAVIPASPVCPVGSGTTIDPCRPSTGACSSISASTCTAARFVDLNGGTSIALLPAGAGMSPDTPLSLADIVAALAITPSTSP